MRGSVFISILCITSVLLKQSLPLYILAHFKANQTELEARFCENKAKPELECHGQCHLKKEVAKAIETPESKKQQKQIEIEVLVWQLTNSKMFDFGVKKFDENTSYTALISLQYIPPALALVEKPPCKTFC